MDFDEAQGALRKYMLGRSGRATETPDTVKAALREGLWRARERAKAKGRPFDLTLEYLIKLFERNSGRCALTGMPFRLEHYEKSRRNPYAPSIDRIDNGLGYTEGNVRLVLTFVNLAIADYGEDVFRRVATAYITGNITPDPLVSDVTLQMPRNPFSENRLSSGAVRED